MARISWVKIYIFSPYRSLMDKDHHHLGSQEEGVNSVLLEVGIESHKNTHYFN